jgi:hypothetical protein
MWNVDFKLRFFITKVVSNANFATSASYIEKNCRLGGRHIVKNIFKKIITNLKIFNFYHMNIYFYETLCLKRRGLFLKAWDANFTFEVTKIWAFHSCKVKFPVGVMYWNWFSISGPLHFCTEKCVCGMLNNVYVFYTERRREANARK